MRARFVRAFARWETLWGSLCAGGIALAAFGSGFGPGLGGGPERTQIPTSITDFFMPGTQENEITDPMLGVNNCRYCHGGYDETHEAFRPWAASMMGQAARDPVFWACLAVAEQDVAFVGDMCIRCHTPGGWVSGNSRPTSGAALTGVDFEGVSCHSCHRMADPVYKPGISPEVDEQILAGLFAPLQHEAHAGQYVLDPFDRRRGPYADAMPLHEWEHSPYHQDAMMCVTCHDVSNPVYTRQPNGTYALNDLDEPHPTQDKLDMFPIERTGSEWLQSAFAKGPINMGGRFGGNKVEVSTCQDCHMPDTTGYGADPGFFPPLREDLGQHHFNGGNTWVLRAVRNLYPDAETHLSQETVDAAISRTEDMLRAASDMELAWQGSTLTVRIINQTGHKLPTGYPEGRRMWVNVRFLDGAGELIAERGAYDTATATLHAQDTKVYQGKIGVDAAVSALSGVPEGPSFHFALNNTWYFDNRIPPRGFTNAGFESVQAQPVGYTYQDGQFWDDTDYQVPAGTERIEARLFYQTTSKEYVEFLRDENVTNDAGQILYDQWVATGRSAPVEMDAMEVTLCYADCDRQTGAGTLDIFDFLCFQDAFVTSDPYACDCDTGTGAGVCDIFDFLCFQDAFVAGCP